MAIDRIPGVGPTNADIATAVAAPSAATIAAAVAAPSAATIASAVNAPSAATIATQVAASVPTLSQINTSVANNSSPFGGTYTNLGTTTLSGTSTTISGLSGYKYLKMWVYFTPNDNGQRFIWRINGDSSAIYSYALRNWTGNNSNVIATRNATSFGVTNNANDVSQINGFEIEIARNDSSVYKFIKSKGIVREGATATMHSSTGVYASTTVISSITFSLASGFSIGNVWMMGAS